MASATAPPTPVSISSNTSVGAEPRSASTTFSASRKRASSPPEATFIKRARPRARIGLHPELDFIDAVGAGGGSLADDFGGEFRPLQLERLELAR